MGFIELLYEVTKHKDPGRMTGPCVKLNYIHLMYMWEEL